MFKRIPCLLVLAALAGVGAWTLVDAAPAAVDLEQALKKAQVDGKYRMLLAQIKVDKDKDTYGEFKDLGLKNMNEYAGHAGLPKGYWVYVHPYWYIWRDLTSVVRPKRQWGPEQATGEPDTDQAGDIVTAWASQSQDEQDEWLMLEYDEFVEPTAVLVHETYNPGALVRVTAFKPDGSEVELWKGADPTPTDSGKGLSEVPVKANFKTNRIKLYIASRDVPGWNEIDAVGIRDKAKKTVWAVVADASTTYAPPFEAVAQQNPFAAHEMRIQQLENEVKEVKTMLKDVLKKLEKMEPAKKDK